MVIAKILTVLVRTASASVQHVMGLHIDYSNRPESGREADFVEQWCSQNNIRFVKRVISEVTRGITDRDQYERMSRDIRYSFYRDTIASVNNGTAESGDGPGHVSAIVFGHHQGDVQENVISNVMRCVVPCGQRQIVQMV